MNKVIARKLRKNLTEAEKVLWQRLRLRQLHGYKFRRQCAIGHYVADFACFERKLIIEIDGGQHSDQVSHDSERTKWFESQGFRVMRFWNNQMLKETDAVIEVISNALPPHLNPPPQGGRKILLAMTSRLQ